MELDGGFGEPWWCPIRNCQENICLIWFYSNSTYHLLRPNTLIVFVIDIVSPLFVRESVPRFFLLLSIHLEEAHHHKFSLLDFTGRPLFLGHLCKWWICHLYLCQYWIKVRGRTHWCNHSKLQQHRIDAYQHRVCNYNLQVFKDCRCKT